MWAILLVALDCQLVERNFGPAGKVPVHVEEVASGLEVPWALAFLPDGDVLVTERPGRLRRLHQGKLEPEPVLTLPVLPTGEGGLAGLALHPQFKQNRLFYLYYTAHSWPVENVIDRYRLDDDGRHATFDRRIFGGISAAEYHDGGRIRFGPDGMLYVGTGDGRQPMRSQDPGSPNGKLLRLTPDGGVPPDNPKPGLPMFALGVRNSEGFDWWDGRLVLVDHGPSSELNRTGHDEVNVVRAGSNLGWPIAYGCERREGMVSPSLTWVEAVPPGGAAFYTGSEIPAWRGSLLVGTLKSRHLHRVVFDGLDHREVAVHEVYFLGDPPAGLGRLREVQMGPDGALWLTTSNCDGRGSCPPGKDRILRVRPGAPPAAAHK
jgi:glucose/arabinose dehydrogenase